MIASHVKDLCILYLLPDLVLLQMLNLVVVGGREIGAKRAVVAGDDNTAAACGRLLVVEILGLDASLAHNLLERLAVLVFSDAANVDGRVRLEDILLESYQLLLCPRLPMPSTYLGTSGSVLRRTACNELCIKVLDEVVIEAHVLLWICEDSIVGIQAILLEKLLIPSPCQHPPSLVHVYHGTQQSNAR